MGIGVDIVKTERFEKARDNPRFMSRIYTPREQDYLSGKGIQSLAGLFAAKEAVAKALGTGFFSGLQPSDIEIQHDSKGKPYVLLHGNAAKNIEISISHTSTDAVAFAVKS